MALKHKDVESKERQEKQAAEDARWKGPWGEITPVEQKHVRFVREVHGVQECWSYPYETLVRQVFKKSEPEEIEILAGGDTITIRGYGLEEFLDTLEKRHLVRVEQRTVRFAASEPNGRCVIEIKIEAANA